MKEEELACAFMERIIRTNCKGKDTGNSITCTCNEAMKDMIYPNCVSLNMRPDVCLIVELEDEDKKVGLPVLQIEVISRTSSTSNGFTSEKDYLATLKKLVLGMIEQFKLYSNYCEGDVVGFVFPNTDKSYVTRVTHSFSLWEPREAFRRLGFFIKEERLSIENATKQLEEAVKKNVKATAVNNVDKDELCYLKLSKHIINCFPTNLNWTFTRNWSTRIGALHK